MVAMCSQRHSVLFFFSGIFFIIAGKRTISSILHRFEWDFFHFSQHQLNEQVALLFHFPLSFAPNRCETWTGNIIKRKESSKAPLMTKTIFSSFFFRLVFKNYLGLIMLIGIIMYISLFKSEIGSKLRPRSMFQSPLFTYRYGHSFILFIIGCISAEIVGTLNFFLFIQIREIGREKVSALRHTEWFAHFLCVLLCTSRAWRTFSIVRCEN